VTFTFETNLATSGGGNLTFVGNAIALLAVLVWRKIFHL